MLRLKYWDYVNPGEGPDREDGLQLPNPKEPTVLVGAGRVPCSPAALQNPRGMVKRQVLQLVVGKIWSKDTNWRSMVVLQNFILGWFALFLGEVEWGCGASGR